MFVFLKQKTAYEMRISDWSSDVCSSDLLSSKQHSKPRRSPAVGRRKTARDFKRLPETVPSLPGRAGGLHGPAPGPRLKGLGGSALGLGARQGGAVGGPARTRPASPGSLPGVGGGHVPIGRASCGERGCQYV